MWELWRTGQDSNPRLPLSLLLGWRAQLEPTSLLARVPRAQHQLEQLVSSPSALDMRRPQSQFACPQRTSSPCHDDSAF